MERPHILLSVLQWGGWSIILVLCGFVGLSGRAWTASGTESSRYRRAQGL